MILLVVCCSLGLPLSSRAPQEETETIIVTRLADEVVIYSAQLNTEKRLYYWDKRYHIARGDEVRQGSGGVSEIRFADGTLIRSFHGTVIRPLGFEGGVRSIVLKSVYYTLVELGSDRTRIRLPGGAYFEGSMSHLVIDQRDEAAWTLKNSGPEVVKLEGLPRTAGVSELQPGYRIVIPNLPPLDRGPTGQIHEDVLSGLRVQAGDGVRLEHSAVGLMLSGIGPGDGLADIGGARLLVVEGYQLHLARVARPLPHSIPTPEQPAPAVREPPAVEPAEPPGPPLPDAGAPPDAGTPPDAEPTETGPPVDVDPDEAAGPPIPTDDGGG